MPFGQDFTPATLGKKLGEDAVLGWLLQAASTGAQAAFKRKVASECLSHVANEKDRRDMATHVVNAMRSYKLVSIDAADGISLTAAGELIREAAGVERDVLFARHIIAMCKGQRFLDAIKRYELRGEVPDMEDLSLELGESATSKNISTIRAWLARAGVASAKGAYKVLDDGLDRVLGEGVASLYGLDRLSVEFLLAARIVQQQGGTRPLDAVAVAAVFAARPRLRSRARPELLFLTRPRGRGPGRMRSILRDGASAFGLRGAPPGFLEPVPRANALRRDLRQRLFVPRSKPGVAPRFGRAARQLENARRVVQLQPAWPQ